MKADIKDRWIKALRSGEYKQCRSQLHNVKENSFCCLGVLCDLTKEELGGEWNEWEQIKYKDDKAASATLPEIVMKYCDLHSCDGLYNKNCSLAMDNDKGKSFEEIADIIERNF
jgi:hypothetical protein